MFCILLMPLVLWAALAMAAERLERHAYPADGRLGYTGLIFLFWRADPMTNAVPAPHSPLHNAVER